jgi:hypothetical protein
MRIGVRISSMVFGFLNNAANALAMLSDYLSDVLNAGNVSN